MRIIISGGGTGGHIFPALAIGNALKRRNPTCQVLFVGALGRMEMEQVPAAGYEIKGLWISGLQRRLTLKNLLFPLKVVHSLVKACLIIRNFKPDVVVGVGGYASGPTLRAATFMRIPTLIQEQNSYAGITNRLLASRIDRVCVAYAGMEKFFPSEKIVFTGNPVRQEVVELVVSKESALAFFGLQPGKPVLLVLGGSLGARNINLALKDTLGQIMKADIQVIWQTGKGYYAEMQSAFSGRELQGVVICDFIARMDHAYAAADLIISRAGAITISELCLIGKPVILVPSPNVAEDHQTKNAQALVNQNAAVMVKDQQAGRALEAVVTELMQDKGRQAQLATAIKYLAKSQAAEQIAEEVEKLISQRNDRDT